ncbi:uncharacterized protein [Littorina saxatilis]|uniref:C1q domain-containing protein n=1 Tax=Littorina saxatilis TaxID=31220 RepID=A0AAN9G778_9CAEN
MNPIACLFIAAALLALAHCQDLSFVAEPSNVVNGTTKTLTITCRAPSNVDADVNLIILLQVDQLKDNVTVPVASERTGGTVTHAKNDRVTAEGALSGDEGAFLTVNISAPTKTDTGKYQCRFAYLNMELFKFSLLNKSIDVTFTEPDEPTPKPVVDGACSCEQVWAEVKNLRETLISENKELRQQLKSYDDTCRVSFTAQIGERLGPQFGSNDLVIFDSVVTNKGEAYDVAKGIFTAPCNGQYFLRLSMRTHQERDSGYVDAAIEVNGEEAARTSVYTPDHMDHYEQASNGLVLTLEEGDEVQVRIQTNSAGRLYGQEYSIFTGFFLSP